MRGFVDESSRDGPGGLCYVTAAAVAVENEAEARRVLKKLRRPGAVSVHWHDDRAHARRVELLEALADLDLQAFATYRHLVPPRRQERARRQCLAALADDLATEGVTDMVIESRQPAQDRQDRSLMLGIQQAGRAPGLSYGHVMKPDEPLLWAADIITGVLSMHLVGVDSRYFTMMSGSLLHIRALEP